MPEIFPDKLSFGSTPIASEKQLFQKKLSDNTKFSPHYLGIVPVHLVTFHRSFHIFLFLFLILFLFHFFFLFPVQHHYSTSKKKKKDDEKKITQWIRILFVQDDLSRAHDCTHGSL